MTRSPIDRSLPRSGEFLQSASNPTPANTLPVGFTVTQGLFWFWSAQAALHQPGRSPRRGPRSHLRLDSASRVRFGKCQRPRKRGALYWPTGNHKRQRKPGNRSADAGTAARGGPATYSSTTTISADPRPDRCRAGTTCASRFAARPSAAESILRLECSPRAADRTSRSGSATAEGNTTSTRGRGDDRSPKHRSRQPQPAPGQPQPGPGNRGRGSRVPTLILHLSHRTRTHE